MSTMTATQFDFLRDLVRKESAIVLEPGKEYLVESRLAPIARREGLGSVSLWRSSPRHQAPHCAGRSLTR